MPRRRLADLLLLAFFAALLAGASALADEAARQDRQSQRIHAPVAGLSDAQRPLESGAAPPSDNFDFFSDKPVESSAVVELPPEKSKWITVGGPLALIGFFFALNLLIRRLVPFDDHSIELNLRGLPPAAKRGIAMAVAMFGIAFAFGASEIWYQVRIYGSADAFFQQMSLGKLIVMTHAHLFGFTTSFFIIGIPFSMQFNHLKSYQWVFPVGLAASLTDVISWWGIKYLAPSFEQVSIFCGVLFSVSYLWMLIGLLRVLLFPEVIWASDKDRAERLAARAAQNKP